MAEDCSCRIPLIGINEHTGNDPVAVECLTIDKARVRLTSIRGCTVPTKYDRPITIGWRGEKKGLKRTPEVRVLTSRLDSTSSWQALLDRQVQC